MACVSCLAVESTESTEDRLCLPAGEAPDLGGAGARGKGRVERVDIEGQIGRRIADRVADALSGG